jgi:Mg-chelatase subunit ChlD
MTRAFTRWLLTPFTLSLACGDAGGASDSATGGLSAVTITSASASASETTPTTSGGSTDASATGESTSGVSQSASETGDATTSDPTTTQSTTGDTTGSTGVVTATTGGTTGDGTTGPLMPEPCQVEETQINPIPPDVLLVLDKSGSMSMESWDHDDDPQTPVVTRWYSLHVVVESIVNKFNKTVNFGVKLFPKIDAGSYIDEGACDVDAGVEVEIAPMNAAGVLAKVPAADFAVLGGTPMETGLKEAFKYLQALDPSKQRFALLIADGEISKTCQGEIFNEALGAVKGGFAMGIPTYVVGIDVDASTSAQLKYLAEAGGKPNAANPDSFYQTTSQTELQAALQQIVDDTLSCVIDVDPEPSEPELFQVWIGQTQIDAATDCAKDDGWVWTKPHSQIELCGQACLDLKKSGQVEARYFCEAG